MNSPGGGKLVVHHIWLFIRAIRVYPWLNCRFQVYQKMKNRTIFARPNRTFTGC
jgi:hypothetical protein